MTTRNFFVNHGLECGDIVISASNNTITGLSTAAPTADGDVANKKYVDDQASASLVFTNKTFDANGTGNSLSNVEVADFAAGVLDTDLSTVSASDDTLPSAKATKSYVDGQISAGVDTHTTITEGNSSVVVADSGTGTITVSADGGTVASFASAATTITASGAINLTAGTDVAIPNNVGVLFGTGGEKIESDGTDLTLTSTGELTLTATGNTIVSNNLTINGNLTVNGTETIVNTQSLDVEDSIIGLNRNNSFAATMPRFSGVHLHRGTGSSATELDLYMVWDEQTNATGSTTNLGGVFTFLGSVHAEGTEVPNSDFTLADIKCSTIEANLTGTATAAEYSDVAERFAADTAYEPGTVVALGGAAEITAVNEEASDEVFGVISSLDQAAFKMNGGAGNDETHPYIAMTGRVDVKVIGTVNKGDRLISASVPGYAKAATKAECTAFNVIGRALTSKTDNGPGTVLAAVRVSH
jgi:hypothetical protein